MMEGSFISMEYIATFYASTNDIKNSIEYINRAYKLQPALTIKWLLLSDDFYKITSNPEFVKSEKNPNRRVEK